MTFFTINFITNDYIGKEKKNSIWLSWWKSLKMRLNLRRVSLQKKKKEKKKGRKKLKYKNNICTIFVLHFLFFIGTLAIKFELDAFRTRKQLVQAERRRVTPDACVTSTYLPTYLLLPIYHPKSLIGLLARKFEQKRTFSCFQIPTLVVSIRRILRHGCT